MNSHTTERFRKSFKALPKQIQKQTRETYKLFKKDPFYPSINFKQVHPVKPIFSARINIEYRALGVRDGEDIVWFWIGSHADYDKLLLRL